MSRNTDKPVSPSTHHSDPERSPRHLAFIRDLQRELFRTGQGHREFAARAGISTSTLHRITHGYPCTAAVAGRIGRALAELPVVVPDRLLAEEGDHEAA